MSDRLVNYPYVCTIIGFNYAKRCTRLGIGGHGRGSGAVAVQFEDERRLVIGRNDCKLDPNGNIEKKMLRRACTEDELVDLIVKYVKESPRGGMHRRILESKCTRRNLTQDQIKKCVQRAKRECGMTTDPRRSDKKDGTFYCFKD